jgi:hypothetical protein
MKDRRAYWQAYYRKHIERYRARSAEYRRTHDRRAQEAATSREWRKRNAAALKLCYGLDIGIAEARAILAAEEIRHAHKHRVSTELRPDQNSLSA